MLYYTKIFFSIILIMILASCKWVSSQPVGEKYWQSVEEIFDTTTYYEANGDLIKLTPIDGKLIASRISNADYFDEHIERHSTVRKLTISQINKLLEKMPEIEHYEIGYFFSSSNYDTDTRNNIFFAVSQNDVDYTYNYNYFAYRFREGGYLDVIYPSSSIRVESARELIESANFRASEGQIRTFKRNEDGISEWVKYVSAANFFKNELASGAARPLD